MENGFETVGAAPDASPLMRTLAAAGVAPAEEPQQSSESSLEWMERELDSLTAQLAAVRERVGQLVADEARRERELQSTREQNAKLREARLADAMRMQELETRLATRDQRAAEFAAKLAELARHADELARG